LVNKRGALEVPSPLSTIHPFLLTRIVGMRNYSSMSQAARQFLERFDSLPEPDQEVVAAEILRRTGPDRFSPIEADDSMTESEEILLTDEQRDEIDRRLAEHDQNPDSALSWDELRTRLDRRFA
jgi:putative addiction module component (TIGR02574 family)